MFPEVEHQVQVPEFKLQYCQKRKQKYKSTNITIIKKHEYCQVPMTHTQVILVN
jgi:hypothetical protein